MRRKDPPQTGKYLLSLSYRRILVRAGQNPRTTTATQCRAGAGAALLGPNGGGKTTLLKTLLGMLAARATRLLCAS
jgi:ABC-type Mn2+/Zn2+ transport system ATPase subunit